MKNLFLFLVLKIKGKKKLVVTFSIFLKFSCQPNTRSSINTKLKHNANSFFIFLSLTPSRVKHSNSALSLFATISRAKGIKH